MASKHFGMLKTADKMKTGTMYLSTRCHGLAPCGKIVQLLLLLANSALLGKQCRASGSNALD